MPETVGYLLLFTGVGVAFILVNLTVGWFLRPAKMDAEKATIYECGEPTVGSAWVQFDLRFYVVALLFVIFDVEMAFFFPWAVVFGKSNQLADPRLDRAERRVALTKEFLVPPVNPSDTSQIHALERFKALLTTDPDQAQAADVARILPPFQRSGDLAKDRNAIRSAANGAVQANVEAATQMGWVAFADILVFFGVLLVGFAYLWKRGDLDWVRSLSSQKADEIALERQRKRELAVLND